MNNSQQQQDDDDENSVAPSNDLRVSSSAQGRQSSGLRPDAGLPLVGDTPTFLRNPASLLASQRESGFSSKEDVDVQTLELGDVIQINAPTNGAIHKQTYYVFYIDDQKLKLLNTSNHQLLKLRVDGYVADESIVSIDLLSRSPFAGYARQHKLEPPQWIDVHFGGDMPVVISGEITNLEEDMIEITTYPGMRVIYVDFAYQGIPEDLPIEKIVLRERPKALQTSLRALASQQDEFDVEQEATAEFDETTGLMTVNVPEGASANPSPEEVIEEFLAEPDGEDDDDDDDEELESLNVAIAVPESERRYSEEMQVADLLGELVSRLPADQRTPAAMKDIHKFVGRFKELRRLFSTFDDNGDVLMPKRTDVMQKPLIDRIVALDKEIPWIVPVVHERNELISITDEKHEDSYNGAASHIETEMSALIARLGPVNRYFREKRPLGIEGNQYDAVARIVDATIMAAPANDLEPASTVFLKDREVKTDIECIVSNDSNYGMDSSVANHGSSHETSVHRLTTRRYTVASNRMILDENSRRRIYHRTPIGVPDRVNVRSVLMMPRAVLLQSHSRSPSANLYLKSKLAEIPVYKFRFLKRGTTVAKREVENLDEEISYENTCVNFADNNVCSSASNESTDQFLSSRPVHYTINDDDASSPEASEEIFRRFLDAIIPRTRNLLYWMKPSLTHLYTQADIIATLEPFLIEQENVTFKQWKDVKFYVKEKIKTYKAAFVAKRKEYEALRGLVSATPVNRIQTMLKEKADFQQVLLSSYPFLSPKKEQESNQEQKQEQNIHSSETLQNLIATDGTAAYASLLNLYLMEFLTIPESVVGIMKPPTISSETTNTIIKSKCGKRFLTKKYHSVAALRKDDNTKDVFYDKEYDDTPYFLADKYKDEKKRFGNDEEFREFFVETLIQKHDCPPHLAPTLANTILLKKKRITLGEYAILEIRPTLVDKLKEADLEDAEKREVEKEADTRKFMEFYKRAKGDVWELDKTVSMDAFIDSNTLFCELSESCNKLTDVAQCVPGEMAALQMRLSKRARMMEEFEDRVARSFEEVAKELRAKLSQMRVQNRRGKVIDDMRLYRQNYRSYEIGKTAISTELVAQSPHIELRDRVFGWPDFVAKQGMICVFVDKFCRAPMQNQQDDEHWLYCKDTNTRLFPQSIHRLAMAFAFDQYQQELDRVIRECGQMSDDGDSIVDKYTGYVLRQIEFSAEEGFDDAGFKVSSNAMVEETDIGTMVLNALNKKDRVFEDPTTQAVYNVFKTLSENMGIQKEAAESSIEEFVLRVSLEMLRDETVVQNETAYNELQAERAKQQTKKTSAMPYKTYFNQLLIIIVGCSTFAAMQTLIPTFKTKKTFPGCVKSFAGFPLDEGNTDNSPGLRYVACVLDKSKRASSQPWASIEPLGLEILLKRLKLVMKEYVYPRKDVAHLYKIKRDYLVNYPEETVPEEVSLSKWTLFQPPLIAFSLDGRAATGITEEFEKELFRAVMQGSAEQFKMIGALKGKALKHGYAVYDAIDRVVRKKQALLTTSAGAAFLENACCNEDGPHLTPIAYFQKERPELEQLLKKTSKVDDVLTQIKRLSKAKTLFDPKSSRLVGAAVPDTIISRVVYETFIHYCNFDNDAPVPSDLSSFASKKPEYNRFASLDDKIAYLKRHGHAYGINEFHSLMRIVNNRNIVLRKPDKTIDALGGIKDMLDYFEETNSTLVEQKLRELLRATLEEYDPKVALHEERASIRKLNRYLQRATDKMREEILTFLTTHANLSASQVAKTERFLKNATEWNLSDRKSGAKEVENIVLNLSKVYPNKLRTGTFQMEMPKHWNFSPAHRIYLEKETEAFFRAIAALQEESKDGTFQKYLKTVISSVADLALFLEQIPMFAPMMKDGVEYWSLYSDETVRFLQEYCLLSVLHEYVIIANDRDFIQMRAEEIRTSRVEDDDEGLESPGSFDEEGEDYGAATQIRQMRIVESDAAELKKLAGRFMMAMIDRERQTKESMNYSYAEIMERTMGLKYKDKKGITDYLAGLSRDERRVEQALRSHKIGRWNVGMQKGLYQYDKGVYDKEIEQWHQGQDPTGMPEPEGGLEVDDLAREEQAQQSADYDGGDGWENLNEDYTDGVYYEEDAERGDYDEY